MSSAPVKVFLSGFGAVNRGVAKILVDRGGLLPSGRRVVVTGISDSPSSIFGKEVDLADALRRKEDTGKVGDSKGQSGLPEEVDVLLEGTPSDFENPDRFPGLELSRAMLKGGKSVVFASKCSLVHDFDGLASLEAEHGGQIRYSATVCGGLPVVNILKRDLALAKISRVSGIFNSTCGYILTEWAKGKSGEEALSEAQAAGIAEADPKLDLNGFDTAAKLYLILKTIGKEIQFKDIAIEGIEAIIEADGAADGEEDFANVRLVASWKEGEVPRVAPVDTETGSYLERFKGPEMGVEVETDLFETLRFNTLEEGTVPTSAAVLRDLDDISRATLAPASPGPDDFLLV